MRLLCALICATVAGAAMGQAGAPPDVPRNHWAFKAVDDLFRAGILHGYPDGMFKGSRPASRSELATAAGKRMRFAQAGGISGKFATKQELESLRLQIASLRSAVEQVKRQHDELDGLRSQMASLREQLAKIRADVDGIRHSR